MLGLGFEPTLFVRRELELKSSAKSLGQPNSFLRDNKMKYNVNTESINQSIIYIIYLNAHYKIVITYCIIQCELFTLHAIWLILW